jgi:hypothetical protein
MKPSRSKGVRGQFVEKIKLSTNKNRPRQGGLMLYLGADLLHKLERFVADERDRVGYPLSHAAIVRKMIEDALKDYS